MKDPSNQSGWGAHGGRGFISIWLFSSAFLGFVMGLFEAALLWTKPRVYPLLVPDVGWVIWFLAPLVDTLFFALVGLGLGLLARRFHYTVVFAALEAALGSTFAFFIVEFFHLEIGLHSFSFKAGVLWHVTMLGLSVGVFLIVLGATWSRFSMFTEALQALLKRPLRWGFVAAMVVMLAGVGVFARWPKLSGPAAPPTAPPPAGAPNIIFITLDTVRADHLSSYGYSRPTTPNLDRFARTGVLFENAIAASSWTLASHASMFTSFLPQQHGADFAVPLAAGTSTLAAILRSRGYATGGFVANHLYLERGWGIARGFSTYDDYTWSVGKNLSETLVGNAIVQPLYQTLWSYDWMERRNAADINAQVERWLRAPPARPYFLFINYLDAHEPYLTTASYNDRFGRLSPSLARKLHLFAHNPKPLEEFSPGQRKALVDGYDNCLAYLDDRVGKLLKFLRRTPKWRNTVVVITSDHGEEFGEHGAYTHGYDLYQETLHVPLIIAGPGIPKGLRVSRLVATRQLFSTVLNLAGDRRSPFSDTSLARFWNPNFKPGKFDDAVVSELVSDWPGEEGSMISLTTPQWQYLTRADGREELYRWRSDPAEKDNLATVSLTQPMLHKLRSHLIGLVGDATGPWRGMQYLQALDTVKGPARLSLLHPRSLQQDTKENPFPIGIAQEFFKPAESTPTRLSRSERDLMRSLPYQ
jgi:arylsulfatase A-like enzyme